MHICWAWNTNHQKNTSVNIIWPLDQHETVYPALLLPGGQPCSQGKLCVWWDCGRQPSGWRGHSHRDRDSRRNRNRVGHNIKITFSIAEINYPGLLASWWISVRAFTASTSMRMATSQTTVRGPGDITTPPPWTTELQEPRWVINKPFKSYKRLSLKDRHVGDLGNIAVSDDDIAVVRIEDHLVKLSGDTSVIGRAIVVHEGD